MSERKKPLIVFTKYSPYFVVDMEKLEDSKGNELPLKPVTALCRCGHSMGKPYCDGTHSRYGIDGSKSEERVPYKWKDYWGEKITVHYNAGVCSHDGSCVKGLSSVFNINKRPWINPDKASPEEIIEVIKRCPSGALAYSIDGVRYSDFYNGEPKIKMARKGPLEIYGGVILKDDEGYVPETLDHYTLCRCGHSKNKPFCDGNHLRNKFIDA